MSANKAVWQTVLCLTVCRNGLPGLIFLQDLVCLPRLENTGWLRALQSGCQPGDYRKVWVVYAKAPFADAGQVLRYLGRYTHRVAISDARILAFDGETVTFRWRRPVSKPGDRPTYGTMALTADGFIQRFLLHRVPKGFHRSRDFGILANGCRARTLQAVPDSSRRETPPETGDGAGTVEETREDKPACPKCGSPSEPVLTFPKRPGENPEDVLGPVRKLVRQRGPPCPGGAT